MLDFKRRIAQTRTINPSITPLFQDSIDSINYAHGCLRYAAQLKADLYLSYGLSSLLAAALLCDAERKIVHDVKTPRPRFVSEGYPGVCRSQSIAYTSAQLGKVLAGYAHCTICDDEEYTSFLNAKGVQALHVPSSPQSCDQLMKLIGREVNTVTVLTLYPSAGNQRLDFIGTTLSSAGIRVTIAAPHSTGRQADRKKTVPLANGVHDLTITMGLSFTGPSEMRWP